MSTSQNPGRHRATAARPARSQHAARPGRRRTAAVVAGAFALAGTGVAWAAWTAYGTGPGEAQSVDALDIVVDDLAAATGDLFPGGTGDVVLRVQNPNPYAVQLTTADYGAITGCAAVQPVADVVTLPTPITLPAESETITVTLTDAVTMSKSAGDECQNVGINVVVEFSGTSV